MKTGVLPLYTSRDFYYSDIICICLGDVPDIRNILKEDFIKCNAKNSEAAWAS